MATALVLISCGATQQGSNEQSGTWTVEVPSWKFPPKQTVGNSQTMTITVRNVDTRPIEHLAITIDGLDIQSAQPGLAHPARPIWIVDRAPRGSQSAFVNTWDLGRLEAGASGKYAWILGPVRPDRLIPLTYTIAAGLTGEAKAALPDGGPVTETRTFTIERDLKLDFKPAPAPEPAY